MLSLLRPASWKDRLYIKPPALLMIMRAKIVLCVAFLFRGQQAAHFCRPEPAPAEGVASHFDDSFMSACLIMDWPARSTRQRPGSQGEVRRQELAMWGGFCLDLAGPWLSRR